MSRKGMKSSKYKPGDRMGDWTITEMTIIDGFNIASIECRCGAKRKVRSNHLHSVRCVSCDRARAVDPTIDRPKQRARLAIEAERVEVENDVWHPTVWNSRTVEDLLLRRAARPRRECA